MAMVAAGFTGGEAEELRRAFGFKRSEKRMQQIEVKLRAGMARQGITGDAAEEIIRSITSFALYGFPESHAASFALLVYASAYLKAHYPAAFYTAMLNNQPMGFYHPATLVKDAQRHGVSFTPIDVQTSDWECRVDPDGRVRLGLMYVNGLREEIGKAIANPTSSQRLRPERGAESPSESERGWGPASAEKRLRPERGAESPSESERGWGPASADKCPKCGCDDSSMLEETPNQTRFCNICAHEWGEVATPPSQDSGPRYQSIDDLIAKTGLRRDELATLADIGALNAFGHDRRTALWQIERAARPAGELFEEVDAAAVTPAAGSGSPLRPMTPIERVTADYAGMSLTIGPHPMALRRAELALRGVLRARDLSGGRHGRRVRVAGAVITRQRPGTAKGFVFLTLEDETGIANIIVRPDLFTEQRTAIIGAPYLLVEGTLQIQEGVTSIKAERFVPLEGGSPEPQSHDFR